jgi:hypothetical protein
VEEGVASSEIRLHKDLIMSYIKELGTLNEPQTSGTSSPSLFGANPEQIFSSDSLLQKVELPSYQSVTSEQDQPPQGIESMTQTQNIE